MKTKILTGLFAFLLSVSSAFAFSDIAGDPAEAAILALEQKGIVTSKENFFPDNEINRAEFVKFALTAFYSGELETLKSGVFSDVPSDEWYSSFVATARKIGAVRGYEDGNFYPARSITRAEALKVILALAGFSPNKEATSSFVDVNAGAWFASWIALAEQKCLIPTDKKVFFPSQNIRRGEMAHWVFDLLRMVNGEDLCVADEEKGATTEEIPLEEVDTSEWTSYQNEREKYDFALPKLLYWKRENTEKRLDVAEDENFEKKVLSISVVSGAAEERSEEVDEETFSLTLPGNDNAHFELRGSKENANIMRAAANFLAFWDENSAHIATDDTVKIPTVIPRNATNIPVIAFSLTAPKDEAAVLKALTISRRSLGSEDEISGIKLFQGWTHLGATKTINRESQNATISLLSDAVEIPAGETRNFVVKADFDTEDFGGEHSFLLLSAEDIDLVGAESGEQLDISGKFPIEGREGVVKNILSGKADVMIDMETELPALGNEIKLAKITLGEIAGENNLVLSGFTLSFEGVSDSALKDLFITLRGERISPSVAPKDGRATFVFDEPLSVTRNREKTVALVGDILGNLSDFSVHIDDIADDLFTESVVEE